MAKALWQVDKKSKIAKTVIGRGLEITIQSPLSDLRVGVPVSFKVLLDGRAVEARLMLAKTGASEEEHAYIYRAKSNEKGMAKISFDSAGIYMLRSKVKLKAGQFSARDENKIALMELSSSFVFSITE